MNFQQIRDFVNPAVGQATGIEPVETLAMPVPSAHLMQAGGSLTVDSELSETSTNPVENRVITAALKNSGALNEFPIIMSGNNIVDKTFEEIKNAFLNNKQVPVLYDIFSQYPTAYQFANSTIINNKLTFQFMHIVITGMPALLIIIYNIHEDNTMSSSNYTVAL